ncbi:hypothetical protein G3A_00760 [Bacillus sp. 17376]|uniref:Uncharacterized protein n=1 Tax=Mesobacillus boroniphilus JCM 21738 TaxID=1294265 RepID=W4RNV8_9BACI|nr:hypothetical protein G3A_00760 [Bacillus sp. 17376]GAE45986.1 hypothetical protein JCM21738_2842 [Mesobacillus boroniphilus JCM 21738]
MMKISLEIRDINRKLLIFLQLCKACDNNHSIDFASLIILDNDFQQKNDNVHLLFLKKVGFYYHS